MSVCVPEMFAAQAARTPDGIAVICGDDELTYRELADRVAHLAARLTELGVEPDSVVALHVERSPDMIVGIFGILAAAGAYLPLEPTTPDERLELILRDAAARVLVTDRRAGPPPGKFDTVFLDALDTTAGRVPESPTDPSSLAYVIYTSGSTGVPKGIGIDHQALRDRISAKIDMFGLGPRDRILQFAGLSFDAAGAEIYPTLLSGATLVIQRDPARTTPAELLLECVRHRVTGVMLPPVFWHLLVDMLAASRTQVPWLRFFLTGGESIPVERLRQWATLAPHRPRFLYAYGPTEATITAALHESSMDPEQIRSLARVPVGRPMPGTRILLLDERLRSVDDGAVGEIYIAGAGLARGYVGDPALTAERFLPSLDEPGARMYRTGDLGKLSPAGELEFLGRVDDQVKVRGYRVDVGDVEAALARHPDLSAVVVVVRGSRLAAYCVPVEGTAPTGSELRRFLRERLPDYMVPASMVLLDALPVTPGGKIDRKALPEPVREVSEEDLPFSPVEEALGKIWCELLRRETVGVAENFFDLGGDSLLANRMTTMIRDTIGVEVPLREIFTSPTVAALAAILTRLAVDTVEADELLELLADLEQQPETS